MNEATTDTRYLSYSHAARYLGISIGTLRRLVEAGSVRSYKVCERLCRFDRAELDKLIHKSATEAEGVAG